jgi:radical SAM protein with 4Fe4S-binding SPASM domain
MSIGQEYEFIIQWHLTERCNLRCIHCYQEGSRGGDLSLDEVRSGLDEIQDLFSAWSEAHGLTFAPSFNITGGEPLLRSDLFDILGDITDRGWDIYVLTNGTLVDTAIARRFAGLGVKGVQVSLEGPEKIHDALRGVESYRASLTGIRALLQEGLPVTVNTTLSEVNAEGFFDLADTAAKLGVQRLGFSRLVPSGRGGALAGRMLSPESVRNLYQRILSLSYNGMKLVTGDPVCSRMRAGDDGSEDQGDVAVGGCSAGVSGLTFLSDGTIVPCRRLPVPLGNIRTDSIREVWALSPVLDALRHRSRYEGKCGACRKWATCRGCRAIAAAVSGRRDMLAVVADDPQCPFSS